MSQTCIANPTPDPSHLLLAERAFLEYAEHVCEQLTFQQSPLALEVVPLIPLLRACIHLAEHGSIPLQQVECRMKDIQAIFDKAGAAA